MQEPSDAKEDAPLFDRYAGSYNKDLDQAIAFSGRDSVFFATAKVDLLKRIISSHIRDLSNVRMLDVGCGTGALHPQLGNLGAKITGADISIASLQTAAKSNPDAHYIAFDGLTLPFLDHSFDVTIAVCAFHHISASQQPFLLSEMCRVTRPKGLLAIIEHNPLNPLTRLAVMKCPFDEGCILLPARASRQLFKQVHIHAQTEYFLFFPFRNRLLSAIEMKMGKLCLGAQYCTYGIR